MDGWNKGQMDGQETDRSVGRWMDGWVGSRVLSGWVG